jgi:hypothetical protein
MAGKTGGVQVQTDLPTVRGPGEPVKPGPGKPPRRRWTEQTNYLHRQYGCGQVLVV